MKHSPVSPSVQAGLEKPRSVLIVDPDASELGELIWQLRDRGLDVQIADGFGAAKLLMLERIPSFIICELKLPDGSGFELLRLMRRVSRRTRIIVHSRYINVQIAVKAARFGAFDIVPKSCFPSILTAALLGEDNLGDCLAGVPHPKALRAQYINDLYNAAGNNITHTARQLNMHRRTLQRHMQRHRQQTASNAAGEFLYDVAE